MTREIAEAIARRVAECVPPWIAARAEGVPRKAWAAWRARARRDPDCPEAAYLETIETAQAQAIQRIIEAIAKSTNKRMGRPLKGTAGTPAPPDWKAQAFLASHLFGAIFHEFRPDIENEVNRRLKGERRILLDRLRASLLPEDVARIEASMVDGIKLMRAPAPALPPSSAPTPSGEEDPDGTAAGS